MGTMFLAARLLVTRRTVTVPVADGAASALTGPELLTGAEQVDCLSRGGGTPDRHRPHEPRAGG